jgi:UDP-N-acetylglucosamine/UDP-N-acetylgalactosamine diphosphorylase
MISSTEGRHETMRATLESYGQAHLLRFYDELAKAQREALLGELEAQDWEELAELVASHVLAKPEVAPSGTIEPAPYYPREPSARLEAKYREARALGERLIREGKVAAFTVAGGQGTRLGWDGPKGTFPATPILGKPLFRVFAEFLLKAEKKFGSPVPWYIMTSPLNDHKTRAFFKDHDFFGLDPAQVMLFAQGTLPSIGFDGKVLLAEKGKLALNPDGHGGSLRALRRSGALDDMMGRGVTEISYFQVDNPSVKCLDPLFIGLHALDGAEMSSKMLPKREPLEKVGNFCLIDGRVSVIEYSDMPEALAKARDEDGSLKFNAGSIAIHVLSVAFVRRLSEGGRLMLPLHRAEKKVPHVDLETGEAIRPEAPNAVKLEAFVFDALPLAERSIILETERVEEFAPIKNAEGEDSPGSSKQLQSLRAARWLSGAGVAVPYRGGEVEAVIELSHLTAIEPKDLKKAELPPRIEPGSEVVL